MADSSSVFDLDENTQLRVESGYTNPYIVIKRNVSESYQKKVFISIEAWQKIKDACDQVNDFNPEKEDLRLLIDEKKSQYVQVSLYKGE